MTEPITVDVWSDIACPWCYIGKRRFESARSAFTAAEGAPEVAVRFHSFELAPDTPVDFEGGEEDFLASHKGVPVERVRQMLAQVTHVASTAGLDYDFDSLKHTNTGKAHELLHFADAHGRQHELVERLMSAYFTEGRHLGRTQELAELAGDVGLDSSAAAKALDDGRYRSAVQQDKAQAAAYGITAVPFFVFDGRYGVAGAQESETFADVLRQVADEKAGADDVA